MAVVALSARRTPAASLLAVAVGGAAGSVLRHVLTVGDTTVGLRTLAINVIGSFLLAHLASGSFVRPGRPAWLRPLLGTGLLGGFTTFSAVTVAAVVLGSEGRTGTALVYLALTVLGAGAAAWAGYRLGARRHRTP